MIKEKTDKDPLEAFTTAMRNSNLLPVKAKGEVRLRSVVSFGKWGMVWTPTFMMVFSLPT